jgi:glycolate oxidase
MLSSVTNPGLENVAQAAPDALRIFQLYVRGDDSFVDDHVERAIANGYAAFCFTVDTAHYSRRERDLAKRYQTAGRRRVEARAWQMALDWRTVARQGLPDSLVIKASRRTESRSSHGVGGSISTGGRRLDHASSSTSPPEIMEASPATPNYGGSAAGLVKASP